MVLQTLKRVCNRILSIISLVLQRLVTVCYRRPLIHFTISPIQEIIIARVDPEKLKEAAKRFREGKQHEHKLVGIASTLSAGATIGVFSWPDVASTHWYARALFYSSLLLAIFSLIGSSQQRLLQAAQCLEDEHAEPEDRKEAMRLFMSLSEYDQDFQDSTAMSWYTSNMVFVWQWTLMLMAWSWIMFLSALMLHVIRPFLPTQDPARADKNVAIWFLAVLGPILMSYGWATWWVGHVTRKSGGTKQTRISLWSVIEEIMN